MNWWSFQYYFIHNWLLINSLILKGLFQRKYSFSVRRILYTKLYWALSLLIQIIYTKLYWTLSLLIQIKYCFLLVPCCTYLILINVTIFKLFHCPNLSNAHINAAILLIYWSNLSLHLIRCHYTFPTSFIIKFILTCP